LVETQVHVFLFYLTGSHHQLALSISLFYEITEPNELNMV